MDGKDYCARARAYASGVLDGTISACEWVRLACERQVNDLERARTGWDWRFDEDRANHICSFIEKLPHVKGRWKSKTIELEDWQCFSLTTIFGWIDAEGLRRFRKALIVIPRKNAKSTLAAGVGLYLLALDEEPGAEVYSAATTRDQAKIVWGEYARKMVLKTPRLRERYGIEALAHSITIEDQGSFFKPLSRDADTLEGLNVHGALVDELHAHKTREVFDVLDDATGSRRQPLIFIISTEGDSSVGVFPEQVEYAQQVLKGRHKGEGADSYFAIYYGLDKEDDWTLEPSWRKANPNYGVSVFPRDMAVRCNQAKSNADSQASFLTKRLNVRVGAGTTYFNMLAWDTICSDEKLKIEQFLNDPCVITLDLASKRDLTSKITVFQRGTDFYVFGKHYLPAKAIEQGQPNYDFYRGWQEEEWLTVTEGNETDYAYIERDLLEDNVRLKPLRVGVDPAYNAAHLAQRMRDAGIPMEDVKHDVLTFSEPMKTIEAMIVGGRIHHNGDPVLAWSMGNTMAKRDVKDNVYPRKARDENKIDPTVALIANMSLHARIQDDTITFTGLRSVG